MTGRSVFAVALVFALISTMFTIESTTAIIRNKVWFEVYHSYGFGTREDAVTNTPVSRTLIWGFHIENPQDETGQGMVNPNIKIQTDLELTDFWPQNPTIYDGTYEWQFALDLPENYGISGGAAEPNSSDYSALGLSARREVSPEILVDPNRNQNLSLSITFEALPVDVNRIDININTETRLLPSGEEQLLNYTILSINDVENWNHHDTGWHANPSDILIGKTYVFKATFEVAKSSKLEGPIIIKPGIQIVYFHWDNLNPTVGSSATVAHPEGLKVTVSAQGEYEWDTSLSYSRQDFWFEPVVVQPSPPIASFDWNPNVSLIGESVLFNASASSSSVNLAGYLWDFGDGNTTATTIPTIDHVYGREGRYSVALNVSDVNGLWNVTSCPVAVTFGTDLNKDCNVNILDITIVAVAYNAEPGDQSWNSLADLDRNAIVNIVDVTMVAKDYGKSV